MVVIGYDRYNVIVKGFNGTKITPLMAFFILLAVWVYSVGVCIPPFLGWGGYMMGKKPLHFYVAIICTYSVFLEGLYITCSYDYLSEDWNHKSFILYAFIFNYVVPMLFVIFFYSQIVVAVVTHERALKAQAKKMNVDSLRSGQVSPFVIYHIEKLSTIF